MKETAPFFRLKERKERFREILEAWIGTPYRHQCAVVGRGADCSLFIGQAVLDMGILTGMDVPYYPRDWHIHGTREVFLKNLKNNLRQNLSDGLSYDELHRSESLEFGDWVGMSIRSSGVINHSAIYLGDEKIIHSVAGHGVKVTEFNGQWKENHKITFRILERIEDGD